MVALKLIRQEYIRSSKDAISQVQQEIQILKGLSHENINQIIDYGNDGVVKKPSGRTIENLIYIILEYVSGGIFYDIIETFEGLGENRSRFFMK